MDAVKEKKLEVLLSLILVTATLAIYSQVLFNGFINYDDPLYVTENSLVQQGLTIEGALWAFTSFDAANWHPLTWLSHMLDVQMFGMTPLGHHLTNLLLHIANTLLLFLFLVYATGSSWRSFFAALLFGIHPLHVESVAWIAERKDVLSAFFCMLTLLAYLRYSRNRSRTTYLPVMGLFAAALMSKPMVVTLPFVLFFLDYWPLWRFPQSFDAKLPPDGAWKETSLTIVLEKLPLFVLAGISTTMTIMAQKSAGAIKYTASFTENIVNALVSYGTYLFKMVWPGDMVVLYPYVVQPIWKAIAAGSFIVGISFFVWIWRDRRYLLTGWFWYLVTLLPVSGIIRIGEHSIADRYTYIPLIGPFILISWGTWELIEYRRAVKKIIIPVVVGVLIFFFIKTWNQIPYWRDSNVLFRHAIRYTSDNWVAYYNLGNSLLERGDTRGALECILKSIQINPEYPLAYNSLATAYGRFGREDEAIAAFKEALRLDPGLDDARYNLIRAYIQNGEKEAAFTEYRILLKSNRQLASQVEPYFR